MALRFKKVKRRVLAGEDKGEYKYYGMAKATSVTGLDEVCNLICARASFSRADVRSLIESLDWVMDHELRAGRTVKVGELGTFRLSLSSEGALTKKELTAHRIKKARVIFSPGAVLKEVCREVTFEPYEQDVDENPDDNGDDPEEGGGF